MFDWSPYLTGLLSTLLLVLLTWIVSAFKRGVSIVDSTWSLMLPGLAHIHVFGGTPLALPDAASSTLPSKTFIKAMKQTYPGG